MEPYCPSPLQMFAIFQDKYLSGIVNLSGHLYNPSGRQIAEEANRRSTPASFLFPEPGVYCFHQSNTTACIGLRRGSLRFISDSITIKCKLYGMDARCIFFDRTICTIPCRDPLVPNAVFRFPVTWPGHHLVTPHALGDLNFSMRHQK